MTTATTDPNPVAGHVGEGEHVHDHPSDLKYVKIAVLLAAITAAEVSTYFWNGASTGALVAILFPMMIAKFAIVTGYFMHLRYDNPLFRRVFVFGLALATVVFIVTLFSMEFFTNDYLKFLTS